MVTQNIPDHQLSTRLLRGQRHPLGPFDSFSQRLLDKDMTTPLQRPDRIAFMGVRIGGYADRVRTCSFHGPVKIVEQRIAAAQLRIQAFFAAPGRHQPHDLKTIQLMISLCMRSAHIATSYYQYPYRLSFISHYLQIFI